MEIKFRTYNWIMIIYDTIVVSWWKWYADDRDYEDWRYSNILMQYVWLKDKNWKEIYEWDIVYDKLNDKKAEVKMNKFWRWSLFWKDWDRMNDYHWEYIFDWIKPTINIEIIWNIYE
jgi:hypothetical protein